MRVRVSPSPPSNSFCGTKTKPSDIQFINLDFQRQLLQNDFSNQNSSYSGNAVTGTPNTFITTSSGGGYGIGSLDASCMSDSLREYLVTTTRQSNLYQATGRTVDV